MKNKVGIMLKVISYFHKIYLFEVKVENSLCILFFCFLIGRGGFEAENEDAG